MSERVDKFCDDLRDRLNAAESGLGRVKASVVSAKAASQEKIQESLGQAQAKVEASRQQVSEAQTKMKAAMAEKQAETQATVEGWKAQRQIHKLERRADRDEDNAAWAVLLAVDAIERADLAILEAVATRIELEAVAAEGGAEAAATG